MKILLVSTNQFGYLIDYHRYFTYLVGKGHTVKYITWDYGKERIDKENPHVIYISRDGSRLFRLLRFIKAIIRYERQENFDRIFIHCFPLVTTLLFFISNDKMRLDIRTVAIHSGKYKRKLFDSMAAFAARRFKYSSIITDLAARRLGLKRYNVLPLGGAYFDNTPAQSEIDTYGRLFTGGDFIFLYVGTLHKRGIIDCVKGFHAFLRKNTHAKAKFLIVGQAIYHELDEIKEYVAKNGLERHIFTLGYIPQHKLAIFFKHADCGVTYFPVTPFLDVQPSTKTYEYLINGVPVIATATKDNVRLLTESSVPCGIVINDNAEEFEAAVGKVIDQRGVYNREAISREFRKYEWDNLLRQYLDPILGLRESKAGALA